MNLKQWFGKKYYAQFTGWPKNLEFDNLGKQKKLEFFRKIMEKPGTFF